jgi:very-short-patch-repair endonuclease
VDVELARIAARQHRALHGDQLRAVGLSKEAIRYRVKQCRLQRLWRDVYVLGPDRPGFLSWAMAAVLATGGDGVLSHCWAAWLWGFVETIEPPVDVTVSRGSHCGRDGLVIHRAGRIDSTRKRGIPITTPAQTLLDYAEVVDLGELERAVAQAQVKGVVRETQLRDVIARSPGRHGVAPLKAILEVGPRYTAAESERRMLALARMADLPRPETNAKLLRFRVDFLWRDQKLIVEVDGFATHGHRRAFENDRRRNAALVAAGYTVMQVTWRQLTDEPIAVAARIAAALARG